MKIDYSKNPVFSTVQISNIFFSEYLPTLDPVSVKVYIYCIYLAKNNIDYTLDSIAQNLMLDRSQVEAALISLDGAGLLYWRNGVISLCDLMQMEIMRTYRPRTSSSPEEFADGFSPERHKEMVEVTKAISDKFFSGQMPASWYNEIDLWYEKYGFTPDVMFMLFQQGAANKAITKPYLGKIAESWHQKHIHTSEQLESYLAEYEKFTVFKKEVFKKLGRRGNINVYEEEILDRWFFTYGYTMEIVEIALRKSVSKNNCTLATFDYFLSEWYKNGLKTVQEVQAYEGSKKEKYKNRNNAGQDQKDNYQQRKYDNDFLNKLYKND